MNEEGNIILKTLNVEVMVTKICGIQRNRSNVLLSTAEELYKKSVLTPYLDDLITKLVSIVK